MPFDPTELIDSVQRNVGLLPAAIGAILLLAGPTAAWIIYRMVVQPRAARPTAGSTDLMWVCEQCRSANEVRRGSCYRCGFRQDSATGDLHVIDGTGLVVIGEDGRPTTGIPVGPGPDPGSPLIVGPVVAGPKPKAPVAVGPGKARVTAPASIVVSERPVLRTPVAIPIDAPPAAKAPAAKAPAAEAAAAVAVAVAVAPAVSTDPQPAAAPETEPAAAAIRVAEPQEAADEATAADVTPAGDRADVGQAEAPQADRDPVPAGPPSKPKPKPKAKAKAKPKPSKGRSSR